MHIHVEAYRSAFRALPEKNLTQAQISFKAEAQKGLHEDLAALTAKHVKECLAVDVAEEVAMLCAVAQRMNPAMKIDAVIA